MFTGRKPKFPSAANFSHPVHRPVFDLKPPAAGKKRLFALLCAGIGFSSELRRFLTRL
jgi:hypothetical protein